MLKSTCSLDRIKLKFTDKVLICQDFENKTRRRKIQKKSVFSLFAVHSAGPGGNAQKSPPIEMDGLFGVIVLRVRSL